MIIAVFRFFKRFALLLPVLIVAYLSVFNIFPLLNNDLPIVAALIITYILGAYVLTPALIRLARIVFPAQHLPHYAVTGDGFASDPLNIGIIGTRQQVVDAMHKAGWTQADPLRPKTVVRMMLSTVYQWSYPNAPVSSLYLFGRKQDLAFQRPISRSTESRHHVRFWAATYQDGKRLSVKSINWQHRQAHVLDDRLLWVGAASRDIGVTFTRHSGQFTHLVDSDTDAERELLVGDLTENAGLSLHRTVPLGDPYLLLNIHALRGHIKTDGRMKVLEITAKKTASGQGSSKTKTSVQSTKQSQK